MKATTVRAILPADGLETLRASNIPKREKRSMRKRNAIPPAATAKACLKIIYPKKVTAAPNTIIRVPRTHGWSFKKVIHAVTEYLGHPLS
jgi:hypothetical protein